jgi:hypothetical protein
MNHKGPRWIQNPARKGTRGKCKKLSGNYNKTPDEEELKNHPVFLYDLNYIIVKQ